MSTVNDVCIQYPYKAEADTSEDKEFWYVSVPAVDYIREAFFGAISTLGFAESYNPISDAAAEYGSEIGASLTQFPGAFVSDQAANAFWSGPTSGAAAPPAFRPVVPADILTALTTPPPIGAATPNTGKFTTLIANPSVATDVPVLIKGAASQSGNLLEFQNSAASILNAFKPTGRVDFGNVNSGALAMNVFRGAVGNGTVAAIQGNGITNGGGIVVLHMSAMTGSVYALLANCDSSADGYFEIRQAGAGNSVFSHFVIGAGDAKSLYQKSGGTTWALGMDQSDGSKFKLSLHSNLGTNDRLIFDVDGLAKHLFAVSGTNTVVDGMTLDGQSTGTPAAGFGSAIVTTLESSTTLARRASIIETVWNTPTDAGAIPDLALSVYYNAGGTVTKREGIRFRGDSAALKWVIGGGTPTATETVTGSRGGNAALADLLTKLASKGIIVDGSS